MKQLPNLVKQYLPIIKMVARWALALLMIPVRLLIILIIGSTLGVNLEHLLPGNLFLDWLQWWESGGPVDFRGLSFWLIFMLLAYGWRSPFFTAGFSTNSDKKTSV